MNADSAHNIAEGVIANTDVSKFIKLIEARAKEGYFDVALAVRDEPTYLEKEKLKKLGYEIGSTNYKLVISWGNLD